MAGITFLSENYADSAELSLTTGTENAQFPLENLQNDSPSVKFKSNESTCVILLDLLMTRDIDYIAIAADPLTSFRITSASVKTSTTTNFSLSTSYSIDLSIPEAIGFTEIPEVSHRYVELTLVGSGGFTELGKVFVGQAINIPLNGFSISSFNYSVFDRSEVRENDYGQKFINSTSQVKELSGTMQYCTKDEQEEIDDMLLRHRKAYPIWVLVDLNNQAMNNGKYKLSVYGYTDGDVKWTADGGQLYSTSISVRQAI